jgi:23S rRNA pseudouridine2605 synthase
VDGEIVTDMGVRVRPEQRVHVDGREARAAEKLYTVVLNKPRGVVTTLRDPEGRPTVARYLPDYGVPLKPVGRLDMDTEGLLLLTNDGDLAHRLTHPSFGVEKEYEAVVQGAVEERALRQLRQGVFIEGKRTSPAKVEIGHVEAKAGTTLLRITIHEGRKRQVRLMCDAVGHPVKTLRRVRYAHLRVRGMRVGEARLLGKVEVDRLRELVNLGPT